MRAALAALLIFLFVAVITGTLAFPTHDELILVISSASLLAISWLYSRERKSIKVEKKEVKKKK